MVWQKLLKCRRMMMVVVPRAFPDKKSSFDTYSVMHESALIYICGWHERFHISYQTDNYKFMHNVLDLTFNITYFKHHLWRVTRLDTYYSDESIYLIFLNKNSVEIVLNCLFSKLASLLVHDKIKVKKQNSILFTIELSLLP